MKRSNPYIKFSKGPRDFFFFKENGFFDGTSWDLGQKISKKAKKEIDSESKKIIKIEGFSKRAEFLIKKGYKITI